MQHQIPLQCSHHSSHQMQHRILPQGHHKHHLREHHIPQLVHHKHHLRLRHFHIHHSQHRTPHLQGHHKHRQQEHHKHRQREHHKHHQLGHHSHQQLLLVFLSFLLGTYYVHLGSVDVHYVQRDGSEEICQHGHLFHHDGNRQQPQGQGVRK